MRKYKIIFCVTSTILELFFSPFIMILAFISAISAQEMPSSVNEYCHVTGHAGCSKDRWCIGAGTSYPALKMEISDDGRHLFINGIQGTVIGEGSIYDEKEHHIAWALSLISYSSIFIKQTKESGIVAQLFQDDGGELEFNCSPFQTP